MKTFGDDDNRRMTYLQTSLTSSPTSLWVGTESSISFKQLANPDDIVKILMHNWPVILRGNLILLLGFTYLKNVDTEDRILHDANLHRTKVDTPNVFGQQFCGQFRGSNKFQGPWLDPKKRKTRVWLFWGYVGGANNPVLVDAISEKETLRKISKIWIRFK